ncbi:MAG: hypothetical protein R3B60_05130 [Candidatus Paceibacterota bacterium]
MKENNKSTSRISVWEKWKKASLGKKLGFIGAVLGGLLITIFIFTLLVNLQNQTIGMMDEMNSVTPTYAPTPSADGMMTRGIAPYPIDDNYTSGTDAEDFEIRDYRATIKTSNLNNTCNVIENLKPQPDVVFESANRSEHSCFYRFKTQNNKAETILGVINDLNPEELNQETRTIKKQLENNLNRRQILEENLISVEQVLEEAITSYDELTAIALSSQNASALAKSIDDKIQLIDKLKQRRESTRQQIDSLNRSIAEQQDRLQYTYFTVSIYKWKFVDGKDLIESWKRQIKETISDANQILQNMTLGLITYILFIALWAIYLLIIIVVIKYGWRLVRKIWNS